MCLNIIIEAINTLLFPTWKKYDNKPFAREVILPISFKHF